MENVQYARKQKKDANARKTKMIVRYLQNGTTEIDLRYEDISVNKKIDIIKRLLNNEVIIERKRRKAKFMYSKRYPTRMYSFVRDNLSNMRNKELIQAIQKEFGINIKYSQLADYMNYYGLSRKNVN